MDRPVPLTLIAIINICYGAISFCGMSLGVAQFIALQAGLFDYGVEMPPEMLEMSILERIQALTGFLVSFGLSTALIISGAGLLGGKAWARTVTVLYAVITPIVLIVQNIISYFAVMMQQEEMQELMGGGMTQQQMNMGFQMMFVMMFIILFINIVHCIIVYVIMRLEGVEEWFKAANWSGGETEPAP